MMMSGLSRNVVGDAGDGSIKPRLLQLSGQTGAAWSGFDSLPGQKDSSRSVRPSGLAQHAGCRGSIYQELAMVTMVASLLHQESPCILANVRATPPSVAKTCTGIK